MAGLFFYLHMQTLTLNGVIFLGGRQEGQLPRPGHKLGKQYKKSFWLPCYKDSAHIEECSGKGAFSRQQPTHVAGCYMMDHPDDSNILYTQRLIMLPREWGWGGTAAQ